MLTWLNAVFAELCHPMYWYNRNWSPETLRKLDRAARKARRASLSQARRLRLTLPAARRPRVVSKVCIRLSDRISRRNFNNSR